ncbi:MAG: hypothetical protein ACK4NS_02435 [Saprospiraceae bacterium]
MSKHIWILICCIMGAMGGHAQGISAPSKGDSGAQGLSPAISAQRAEAARVATERLTAKYQLNAAQAKQAYRGQLQKLNNIEEVASLKTSNPSMYIGKMQAIQEGALNSLRRALSTQEQIELFERTQKELRIKRAEMRQSMMKQNAGAIEIEMTLLDLFVE